MTVFAGTGLVLAAFAVYANSFSGPFIFDDLLSIPQNPTIRSLLTSLVPPGGGLTVTGRPLLNLSFALNYALSGNHVWSYHALNLLIHLVSGLTLFGIVRRTLGLVGRVIPNPPLSVSDPSERRVKDNAPYRRCRAHFVKGAMHYSSGFSWWYTSQPR
jgi:hypothetical protein